MTSQPAILSIYSFGGASVTRQITRSGTNFFVTVTVVPPFGTPAYLAEEFIPSGFTVTDISNSGSFDAPNARIVWGPFWDGLTRTLCYTLVPPPGFTGITTLNGDAMFFGGVATTTGDSTIKMTPSTPVTLRLTGLSLYFVVEIDGTAGSTHRLEATDDLLTGQWTPLITVTLPSSSWSFLDFDSAGKTNRFYRTILIE